MNQFAGPKGETVVDRSGEVDRNRSSRPSARTTRPTKRREGFQLCCANPTPLRTTLGQTLDGELAQTISPAPRVSADENRGKQSLGSRIVKT